MKANHRAIILVLLFTIAFNLPAQQVEVDRRLFEEIKSSAARGDSLAELYLGICYDVGKGVTKNFVEAAKCYRNAAEQGIAQAQYNLGVCYYKGDGLKADAAEAVKWYRKAAAQGLAVAQSSLGACLAMGDGVTPDAVEAVKLIRMAAEQGETQAEYNLGFCYNFGLGVAQDPVEAVKWYRRAAEKGLAQAQYNYGLCYFDGRGVTGNTVAAVDLFRKAAAQGFADAQYALGGCYLKGDGITKDASEALNLFLKAAQQGFTKAQYTMGVCYYNANDIVKAHKWLNLASAQGYSKATSLLLELEQQMTNEQISEARKLAREFKPRQTSNSGISSSPQTIAGPKTSGTAFFITEDGYFITNDHVVKDSAQIRLVTDAGLISAKVVKVDASNDLALLKAEGRFAALPVAASRGMKLGGTVATVGFPNIGLQGFAPKLAKGEIASLSGAGDDARYFQISVPVQPGNSGGALVDERGNVVGVVSAKLSALAALAASGSLPENVNYAVKSSYLLSFLESVPEVSAKLKEPNTKEQKFEDVVKTAEQAAVLVLVY